MPGWRPLLYTEKVASGEVLDDFLLLSFILGEAPTRHGARIALDINLYKVRARNAF